MRKTIAAVCSTALALSPFFCAAETSPAESSEVMLDGVAAYVNGDSITVSEVMSATRAVLAADKTKYAGRKPDEVLEEVYSTTLDQLISQKLIVQEYNAGEARIPDWAVEKRIAEIIDTGFNGDRSALIRELSVQRTTFEEWRAHLEEQMIVGAMRQSMVEANINVSPSQVLAYYREHRHEFAGNEEVRLGLIKFTARDGEDETELQKRAETAEEWLKKGENFEGIAKSFSDDYAASKGGDWGWIVPSETLRPELVAALNALPVGGVSDVINTPAGIYIIKKTGVRGDDDMDFKRAAVEITKILEQRERRKMMDDWIAKLRSKATIRINDFNSGNTGK